MEIQPKTLQFCVFRGSYTRRFQKLSISLNKSYQVKLSNICQHCKRHLGSIIRGYEFAIYGRSALKEGSSISFQVIDTSEEKFRVLKFLAYFSSPKDYKNYLEILCSSLNTKIALTMQINERYQSFKF